MGVQELDQPNNIWKAFNQILNFHKIKSLHNLIKNLPKILKFCFLKISEYKNSFVKVKIKKG